MQQLCTHVEYQYTLLWVHFEYKSIQMFRGLVAGEGGQCHPLNHLCMGLWLWLRSVDGRHTHVYLALTQTLDRIEISNYRKHISECPVIATMLFQLGNLPSKATNVLFAKYNERNKNTNCRTFKLWTMHAIYI